MTKLKISRLIEVAKFLTTKSGQELQDFITYVADLAEQVVRALRNGLTFSDNFDAAFRTASLVSGVASTLNVGDRRPVGIIPMQVVSTAYGLDSLTWYVDGSGNTKVQVGFTGSPGTAQVSVVFLIVYG